MKAIDAAGLLWGVVANVSGGDWTQQTEGWQIAAARARDAYHEALAKEANAPIPLLLWCPECGARHIDEGEFATKVHTSHSCQSCGMTWRPAIAPTVGVRFLPGFKNVEPGPKETT